MTQSTRCRLSFRLVAVLGVALAALPAAPARARVGVFFGFALPPVWVAPPPYYYAPPYGYAPPPYYPPPASYPPPPIYAPVPAPADGRGAVIPPAGQVCDAGRFVCPMQRPTTPGAVCWCPGFGGSRVYGHAT